MRVLLEGLRFPEGPAFAPDGRLWCVELEGGGLVRIGGDRVETGGRPNGLTFDGAGRAVFCDSGLNQIRRWDEHRSESLASDLFGPNDLCHDDAGNLLFTCPGDSRREPTGYVAVLDPSGRVSRIADGFYFPNGLALCGRLLTVAETYRHRLWRGEWNGERWLSAEVWAEAGGPVGPDGMAFGPDGLLYVAVYGQGKVKAFDDRGRLVREIFTPGANPTNVAFDPGGQLGMVVTEAEKGQLLSFSSAEFGA